MNHPDSVRLNKAISDSGLCSRRQADALIEKGRVTINGKPAGLGDRVMPDDEVRVDGKLISDKEKLVYIILNKPVGITCTTNTRFDDNVVSFVNHPERVYPVGRLDKPSEGLLLMTNDGAIVNKILRAANEHEKEYIVEVDRPITSSFVERMSSGVPILDTITKPCKVERINQHKFRIVLVQGLNRQIRRMCDYLGYNVVSLKRIRLINIKLGDLPIGKWRDLTDSELRMLKEAVKDSETLPMAMAHRVTNQSKENRGRGNDRRGGAQEKSAQQTRGRRRRG